MGTEGSTAHARRPGLVALPEKRVTYAEGEALVSSPGARAARLSGVCVAKEQPRTGDPGSSEELVHVRNRSESRLYRSGN